ncbi:MAG: hypothetical protein V3V99_03560 [candidate division Zixibacteria bacterium]
MSLKSWGKVYGQPFASVKEQSSGIIFTTMILTDRYGYRHHDVRVARDDKKHRLVTEPH